MTSIYSDADYLAAYKQKQRILRVFLWITAVYAIFCGGFVAYYISLPYVAPKFLPKACVYVASVLYVVFAYVYLSIKYSRAKRYYHMLQYVSEGLKSEETSYFYCFKEFGLQKDNVDVKFCVFETWNKKKQEWMEREVYADVEKPLPDFGEGDLVRYISQGNMLVQYEIVQRQALQFEEEGDEEIEERGEEIKRQIEQS